MRDPVAAGRVDAEAADVLLLRRAEDAHGAHEPHGEPGSAVPTGSRAAAGVDVGQQVVGLGQCVLVVDLRERGALLINETSTRSL